MIRFPDTSPQGEIHRSLPMLFVASLVSHALLQNSVNLGRNAVSEVLGIQISKKFVSTSGCCFVAMLTCAQTVKTDSLLHLSHSSRSISTITSPVIFMFWVPKIGVPIHLSSQSEVLAYRIFSENVPSAPTTCRSFPPGFCRNVAPEIVVSRLSFKFAGSSMFSGLKNLLHLMSITLLTLCPSGIAGEKA